MPPTKQIQGGGFQDELGNALTGALLLILSQDAKVSASSGQIAPTQVRITVSAGNIAPTSIWFNDELTPSGTYYKATLYDSRGNVVYGPEKWTLSGASGLDVGTIVPTSLSVSFPAPVLQTPASPQTITGQSLTLTSSAPLIVQGTLTAATIGPSATQQHTLPVVASDTVALLSASQTLTGKTFDISANTLKAATNTTGHYPRNNGTQYVDATIATADLPATTAPCTGVQLAIGLNAGGTSNCATPPTFVASGASHAVGYVPDPGASAGTTRFLREDASWAASASGVTESTLSWGAASQAQPTIAGCVSGSLQCIQFVLPNAHTLTRLTYFLYTAASGCTTNAVIGLLDVTTSTTIGSLTVTTGAGFKDSGALSLATTAGHTFDLTVITAAAGCTTTPSIGGLTAVFQ